MSRTRKVFEVVTADVDDTVDFDVAFTNKAGEKKTLHFSAYGQPPGGAVMTMTKMQRVTDDGKAMLDVSGMAKFMELALLPESAALWVEMMDDREWMVPAEIVGEVYEYLGEEWAARPTNRSSSSSNGRPSTSDSLTESAS